MSPTANNKQDPKRIKLDNNTSPSQPTMSDSLMFLSTICGSLKNIKRTGWVRMGVPLPESDADHMHRCAMCAMLVTTQEPDPRDDYSGDNERFHPSKIDGVKLLRMALTHDVCESIAGDVTPFCDAGKVASKHDKEKAAMEEIRKMVGDPLGGELYYLWKEYEELMTPEALYCKDIDKFEMVMQAYEYEKANLKAINYVLEDDAEKTVSSEPMRSFFVTTSNTMKSPLFKRLDAELRSKRECMLKERGWDVTPEEK
jgi:putative hydrolase of HD superfamily